MGFLIRWSALYAREKVRCGVQLTISPCSSVPKRGNSMRQRQKHFGLYSSKVLGSLRVPFAPMSKGGSKVSSRFGLFPRSCFWCLLRGPSKEKGMTLGRTSRTLR